jgi:hypothetical protein
MVFQGAVFMRTDLYAVLATVSGSRNLWAVKSALLRTALRRGSDADQNLLAVTAARERRWAAAFLALYLPGLAAAAWYLAAVSLPGLWRLLTLTIGGLAPPDLGTTRAWESIAVLSLVVAPNAAATLAALTSVPRARRRNRRMAHREMRREEKSPSGHRATGHQAAKSLGGV